MVVLTWTFTNNTVFDNQGKRPWRKMTNGTAASTTSGNLKVTSTSGGYYCDISDLDMNRKWKILLKARTDVTLSTSPAYLFSIGPCYQNSTIGGIMVWKPPGTNNIRMDDSAMVSDFSREVNGVSNFNLTTHPTIEITCDPVSDVRKMAMYQDGVLVSSTPIDGKDLDTTYKYLYIGCTLDSGPTPCSFESVTLDNNWDGVSLEFPPSVSNKRYWRVRVLGGCTLTELGLDAYKSVSSDDGVTIRDTSTLTMVEGTVTAVTRLYDKQYAEISVLTPTIVGDWCCVQYSDTVGFNALQLRVGVRSTDQPPPWIEIMYSNDGATWYMDDRIMTPLSNFQTSTGARVNGVATYQRTAVSGRWAYVRNFDAASSSNRPPYTNTKSISFSGGVGQYGSVTMQGAGVTRWMMYTNYTFSVWIKLTSTSGNRTIYHPFAVNENLYNNLLWVMSTNRLEFPHQNPPFTIQCNTTLAANVWYHVALTRGSDYSTSIYLNSSLDNPTTNGARSATIEYSAGATIDMDLGRGWQRNETNNFIGLMDEASIWNVAMTPSEISNLYNVGVPGDVSGHPKFANLQGWWRFESGNGVDSGPFARDLTMSGTSSTDVKTV